MGMQSVQSHRAPKAQRDLSLVQRSKQGKLHFYFVLDLVAGLVC